MSRPPAANATGSILNDAWEGKIIASITISVFQHLFFVPANTVEPERAASTTILADPSAYLHMMVGVLGLFGVGLTVALVVGAYTLAREPGIAIYFIFDYLIASILQSSTVDALLLVVAIPTAIVVIYLYRIWLPQRSRGVF